MSENLAPDGEFYRGDGVDGDQEGAAATEAVIREKKPTSTTPWRVMLEKSVKKNSSEVTSKYIQLATVRDDGTPANRTVVYRGFVPGNDDLYIVTDGRSEKIPQIERKPAAEIAWYLPVSREQYRLTGQLTATGPTSIDPELSTLRQAAWGHMSDSARNGFLWPAPGTSPVADESVFTGAVASKDVVPDDFFIVSLRVSRVDYLCLKGTPQTRKFFTLDDQDGAWVCRDANP